ncbi:inositol monophosphatase family protein [Micromonospora sp. RP3T]|uniref:inositol monophosphatase family protein n=1 Tax=Micromonospora sp. RP3T TaxID=2135446 RepID=UPI003D730A55
MDTDLDFALQLARDAGALMRAGVGATATRKVDGTPVTVVDQQINDMVAAAVAARGADRMLGEEDRHHPSGPHRGRVWVCDPIDGTWLYAAGVPGSVFSLALVDDGAPVVGVVHDPWTDRTVRAVAGGGAYLNGAPLRVNDAAELAGACLALPGGRVDTLDAAAVFGRAVNAGADVVTIGSAVHDALLVALGFAAAAVYPYTSQWDMAAVAVITAEAGGRITNLAGERQRYDGPILGAVVSNGHLHDRVLELLAG